MSFLAPIWLAAAALVGVGVVVAHLFAPTVPPQDVLPTVRFIPESTPLAVLRSRRVSDAWLLLLRLLAVALLGLALAGVHVRRDSPPRVVLIDASRAVGSVAELRDSAIALAAGGSVLVAFDSAAKRVSRDDLSALTLSDGRGSLSAGVAAVHRLLSSATEGRDRTELVIVSPLAQEEVDSATSRLLALWEGPMRVVRVGVAAASAPARVEVRATGDDPVATVIPRSHSTVIPRSAATRDLQGGVRIVRTTATRTDSLWARDSGGVLVLWPADPRGGLVARPVADSQGGIASTRDVVIAPFVRQYQPRPGRTVVRWIDGEPAATEQALGRGCVREVAIPVDPIGDLALRQSFRSVALSLLEPCGGARDLRPYVIPSTTASLSAGFARNLQSGKTLLQSPRSARDDNSLPLWLAVLALGILLAEQLLRSKPRKAV